MQQDKQINANSTRKRKQNKYDQYVFLIKSASLTRTLEAHPQFLPGPLLTDNRKWIASIRFFGLSFLLGCFLLVSAMVEGSEELELFRRRWLMQLARGGWRAVGGQRCSRKRPSGEGEEAEAPRAGKGREGYGGLFQWGLEEEGEQPQPQPRTSHNSWDPDPEFKDGSTRQHAAGGERTEDLLGQLIQDLVFYFYLHPYFCLFVCLFKYLYPFS